MTGGHEINYTQNIQKQPIFKNQSQDKPINSYEGIPQWYLQNRVQVLSALFARDIKTPYFTNFPEALSRAGVTVITRHIKSGDEQPWWPSKYGTIYPPAQKFVQGNENLASDIINQMHKLNMKVIIYYRHMEDSQMLAQHPDWAVKNPKGLNLKSKRGVYLSLNSPYRDVVFERIKELAAYGADGFYFDEVHIPKGGDFSKYSQEEYKSIYKSDMLSDYKAGKVQRYYDFRNRSISNFFNDMRSSLQKVGLNPMLIISGNSWGTFTDLHMTSDFFKNFTLKSELEVPNRISNKPLFLMPEGIRQQIPSFYVNAFCFSFMRDNSFGPPNIWCPQIKSSSEAEAITAGLVSLGCIAELDIKPNPKRSDLNNFLSVLEWNKKYGTFFKKMTPYACIGIWVSEKERNAFVGQPVKAWKDVLVPAYNAFEKIYKNGIPVQLISDAELDNSNKEQLSKIIINNATGSLTSRINSKRILLTQDLKNIDGIELAKMLNTPIYCQKNNEFTHVNYFSDAEGYIYIVTAPDFNSVKADFNEEVKTNLSYKTSKDYDNEVSLNVYIKMAGTDKNLTDLVNGNNSISSIKNDGDYKIFNIKPNKNSIGIYRFKLN